MFTLKKGEKLFYSVAWNRVAKLFSLPSAHSFSCASQRWKEDFPAKLSSGTSFRIHDFLWARRKGEKQAKRNFCRVEAKWILFLFSFTATKCYFEWRRDGVAADSQANYFDLSSQFVMMIPYWQQTARGPPATERRKRRDIDLLHANQLI